MNPGRPRPHDLRHNGRSGALRVRRGGPAVGDFTWGGLCDWYLELVKERLRDPESRPTAQRVLAALVDRLCRLLHPIMPFVTEQVWQGLASCALRGMPSPSPAEESACITAWPRPLGWSDESARQTIDQWCEAIKAIRNLRAERNVPKDARVEPIIVASDGVADGCARGTLPVQPFAGRVRADR